MFSENELVENFIHSKSFTDESRREIIKNDTENKPFLRQAFDVDLISVKDFKKLNRNGILRYLDDFANAEDWENDRIDFVKIKDKFIESLMSVESDKFYLISKEWFDAKDARLKEPESWIYIYYFLIIWLDTANETLTVSEWTYD